MFNLTDLRAFCLLSVERNGGSHENNNKLQISYMFKNFSHMTSRFAEDVYRKIIGVISTDHRPRSTTFKALFDNLFQ